MESSVWLYKIKWWTISVLLLADIALGEQYPTVRTNDVMLIIAKFPNKRSDDFS
jgi:hypothetical protein